MATTNPPGTEITVNHYDFITLFLACKVPKGEEAKKQQRAADLIDQLCRSYVGEGIEFEPTIGQLLGVYLQNHKPNGEWVRGRVEECIQQAKGSQYKVLLIDRGQYVKVQRRHLIQLNEPMKKTPPAAKRLGLQGVLPEATLNQNTRLFLTDFLHSGPIYFKKKQKIESILFGDISVQRESDGKVFSLTGHLLASNLVKKVDNFEEEARQFYSAVEGIEKNEEASYIITQPTDVEEKQESPSPQSSTCNYQDQQDDKMSQSKDTALDREEKVPVINNAVSLSTNKENDSCNLIGCLTSPHLNSKSKCVISMTHRGYSSSDDYYSDGPFVRDDTIFVPAGFQYNDSQSKKNKKSKFENKEVKPIKTHFQLLREKQMKGEKHVKRPKEDTKSINSEELENGNKETLIGKRQFYQDQTTKGLQEEEINCNYQEFFKPRKVSFFGVKPQETKNLSEEAVKKVRAFDLNYKSKVECPEKVIPESEVKLDINSCDSEVTKEKNVKSKEDRREILELTHSSLRCYDDSDVNKRIESVMSSAENGTIVSNDSVISTAGSDNSMLSKKQRVSQKLKAGLAARAIVKRHTENNVEERHTRESVEGKSSGSVEIFVASQKSTLASPVPPKLEIQRINESVGSVCSVGEDFNGSSSSSASGTNFLHTNRQLASQRCEQTKQLDQFSYSDIKDLNTTDYLNSEGNAESITKGKFQPSNLPSKRENSDFEDPSTPGKENSNPNLSLDSVAKCNLLQEKRRRIQEKLRKKKEAEMASDSEASQRDLSASSNQSVCSEASYSSYSKPAEKPTLDSIITVPIEELENQEENFDYVDIIESQTFLRCINTTTGVLIHTKDDRMIRPATSLTDCYLDGNIIQTLERRGKRELNRIQKFSYPTILAGRNIAMISPRRSGKTCGYVVPIASKLLSEEYYTKLPSGNGPRALVVTPCWESGAFAASEFKHMSPFNTVVHCYGGGAELELKVELLQGCDVLVTTPRCVLRLLDYGLTNLKRLCHLVMDDADILFDKFRLEMQKLMVVVDSAEEERERRGVEMRLQVVLAARTWTPPLEELVTLILACPTICVASQLEACVYAGIKPTAVFVQNDKKIEKLVDILKEVEGKQRTVVMCRSKEDVKSVLHLLIDLGVKNVIAAHEDLSSVSISEVPGFWNKNHNISEEIWNESTSLPIMIRSDEVLEDVPVTNATVLIHYNMSNSKKTFSLRFICLMENYHNILKRDAPKKKPQVVILLDEKNDLEVPGVMEFMERLGTVLPEPVLQTLQEIEKMNDQKRMSEPLCEDVKEFGQCWDVKSCPARHLVTAELDCPTDVPRTGWVKIMVQHIHDACHFSVRLLEHAEVKDQWRRLPSNLLALPIKLNNHYATESNRRLHGRPMVGDIVALETARGVYQRAAVLKIVERNKFHEPVRVYIRLIDNGRYDYALVSRMWHLPEEMAAPPPSVVDVYLCGLRPKDLDVSWPPAPGAWVEQQLRAVRRDSPDGYMMGKITFALKGCLWLEPVEYLEFLPSVDTTVFLLNLRKDLLETNNATENGDHIPALRRLCERAGIELPPEEKPKCKKPTQSRPQWAWLPQDRWESVHIIVVQDPEAIFLRLNYFADCLQRLIEEIQKYANAQKEKNNDYKKLLETGDVCLGKSSGSDEWNRAVIKSKPAEDMVELFFADYGDTDVVPWSQVMPISNKLISQLPFQVIECYLAGVKFLPPESENKDWEDEVIDLIYNLSRNDLEEASILTVKVCAVEAKATFTSGKRYKVVLADCSVEPIMIINSQLASSKYAQLWEGEKLLENLEVPDTANDDQSSECDEEIPSSSNLEVVPVAGNSDVALSKYGMDESAMSENDKKVAQFLKDLSEGDFDCSIFHSIENDADISDNTSEGSVLSLPRPAGSLPRASSSHLQLPPPETVGSLSSTGIATSSSQNSSTLSLYQEKNKSEPLPYKSEETRYRTNLESLRSCEPLATSSPQNNFKISEYNSKISEHNSPVTPTSSQATGIVSSDGTSSGSSLKKITGVANNFRDLISPNLLGSQLPLSSSLPSLNLVEKISPFLKRVSRTSPFTEDSVCDELDDNKFENTMSEIVAVFNSDPDDKELDNTKSKIDVDLNSNIDDSNKRTAFQLNGVKPDIETAEEKKSPCQKWVECVIPDSDEDLSLITENSLIGQAADSAELEVRTPLVEWHQDDNFVILHIKLPAVTEFEFSSDITSVHFSAIYGGVPYKVDLPELFGGHKSEKARGTAQACYFEIRLEKLLKGKKKKWPRLTRRDEKLHWLKLNAEKACEGLADSEDEDVKRLACSLPLWNEKPTDSNSVASSDRSELANSELSL